MWFNILKKEEPVAASYATKRTLELVDEIEKLGAEVKIHAPYAINEKDVKSGASLELILKDVAGKKNPVGYIRFKDSTSWKKMRLDSLRGIKNRYFKQYDEIVRLYQDDPNRAERNELLDVITEDYKKEQEDALAEANQDHLYFTFRWHERNDGRFYNDSLEEAIEVNTGFPDYDPESEKHDGDSIIQLVKDLKDFIKDTGFSWGYD